MSIAFSDMARNPAPSKDQRSFFFAIRKLHRILTIHCTFPPHFLRAPAPGLKGADTCTQLVARPRVSLPDLRLWRTNITQHFLPPSSLPPPQKKERTKTAFLNILKVVEIPRSRPKTRGLMSVGNPVTRVVAGGDGFLLVDHFSSSRFVSFLQVDFSYLL